MFTLKREFGDHKIYAFDTQKYDFRKFLSDLYETHDLEHLHLESADYKRFLNKEYERLEDVETDIHKKFYKTIKSENTYKQLYCSLVKDLYEFLFPNEPYLIYQSFPSIRFQFPENIAVPPHADSDELGRHPLGEKNFLVPITSMKGTTRLFVESQPGKGDFEGVDLEYGEILYFNGNRCIHYNESNKENYMRISFDFRMVQKHDYKNYILKEALTQTNPRDAGKERKPVKMNVGGYYQCMFPDETIETSMNWHFNNSLLLQTRPSFDTTEGDACSSYFSNGDPFLTEFKETEKLERQLAEVIGVKHCFMTTSGSTALLVALLALDIQPGDEVIVPNYTMIATANAVKLLGATPVLVDVDSSSLTVSLAHIKESRTPKTKAVIHVSLNNRSKDMNDIVNYCKETNLPMIEDAAQSLGCRLDGKHYGTFGELGCFSLSSPKIITTGQGGFVVTNNDELAKKLFKIKNFGRSSGGVEQYDIFGFNFKFTDIQAVIGQAQLKKLPERVIRMRKLFDMYYTSLRDVSGLEMILPQSDEWIPWFIDVFTDRRDELAFFLKQHNIQTRVVYPSIHSTDAYKQEGTFPISERISTHGLFLPSHLLVTDEQVDFISSIIKMFFM
jgi:perosamine synthetase